VLRTIALDRGCFSCALGGVNRKTLFVIATEWRGMEKVDEVARARTGQVLSIEVATPGV
jgi:sugar lactone lactonase YvrE